MDKIKNNIHIIMYYVSAFVFASISLFILINYSQYHIITIVIASLFFYSSMCRLFIPSVLEDFKTKWTKMKQEIRDKENG